MARILLWVAGALIGGYMSWSAAGCGGSGGDDLSCVPDDLSDPTVNLDTAGGTNPWTLTLTQTSSTCPSPPDSITCQLNMDVSGNDVATSGTCQSNAGVTVTFDNTTGKVSGDTLYWGTTMTTTVGDYSETDTVPCTSVSFVSDTLSETFSVTVDVSYNNAGTTGECSTSFSGIFQ